MAVGSQQEMWKLRTHSAARFVVVNADLEVDKLSFRGASAFEAAGAARCVDYIIFTRSNNKMCILSSLQYSLRSPQTALTFKLPISAPVHRICPYHVVILHAAQSSI